MQLAANISYLFTELPMPARFTAAREAGFAGVEIPFPYDLAARDLHRAAKAEGLAFACMACPPPNWAGGPRGFAAAPGNEARFRSDFDRALRIARALGMQHLHVMAGAAEGEAARRCLVANLKWACERAPRSSLIIEPMNQTDMPGYFLSSFDDAAEIIAEVGAPNLGLQFDAYQAQMIHGDAVAVWTRHAAHTRHIQIAGCPGRHEPRQGEIDFTALFGAIDAAGFRGWVGAEYTPLTSTEAGLRWLRSA